MSQVSSYEVEESHADIAPLRIGFLDVSGWDFHVLTPDSSPLGGSQSAACYLARALAALGHQVFFVSNTSVPGVHANVECIASRSFRNAELAGLKLDACICLLDATLGAKVRQVLGRRTRLVLWTQHASNQTGVRGLLNPLERDAYDHFVLVSAWQAAGFAADFGIPSERITVFPNAVAPAFEGLFDGRASISAGKTKPPVLAYTSTPFRGLSQLLEVFPRIRAAVPGTTLRVYSSMQVYQFSAEAEQAEYGALYERCRRMPGVTYLGGIAQPALARALRDVSILAYPNIFPETSCIAALEAMAAGCLVVTSRLAALPETTAGFGELVDMPAAEEAYLQAFGAAVIRVLENLQASPHALEDRLLQQVQHVNQQARWSRRAGEWVAWLRGLPRRE